MAAPRRVRQKETMGAAHETYNQGRAWYRRFCRSRRTPALFHPVSSIRKLQTLAGTERI